MRFRWQVWRTVKGQGWTCVETNNEDRVYSDSLRCWLRLILVNDKQRIRVGVGTTGDELVPTETEREHAAKLRAEGEILREQDARVREQHARLREQEAKLQAEAEANRERAEKEAIEQKYRALERAFAELKSRLPV